MYIVRIIAMIFLAAFLIFGGLIALLGISLSGMLASLLGLISLVAGVLILISLGCHKHDSTCK